MWPQRQDSEAGVRDYAAELEGRRQAEIERYRAGIKDAIMQSWPVEMAKTAYGAATLPGDVYAGRVDPMSDEAVGRSAELAGLMTLGAGGVPAGRNEMRMGIRGYHGSPHDFAAERLVRFPDGRTDYIVGKPDVLPAVPPKAEIIQDFPLGRFRMDKIGTGEGAQAYGHGPYIAGNEGVAKGYRDALSRGIDDTGLAVRIDGRIVSDPTRDQLHAARFGIDSAAQTIKRQIEGARPKLATASTVDELGIGVSERELAQMGIDELTRRLDEVQRLSGRIEMAPAGRMYEVELNTTPDRLLDWDKPLSGQNPIRSLIGDLGQQYANAGSAEARNVARDAFMAAKNENLSGAGVYNQLTRLANTGGAIGEHLGPLSPRMMSGPSVASQTLRKEAGIDGIKYLDAGSRAAGDGSRNYVMFDDKLIKILRKYGVATAAALPAAALAELGLSRKEAERTF